MFNETTLHKIEKKNCKTLWQKLDPKCRRNPNHPIRKDPPYRLNEEIIWYYIFEPDNPRPKSEDGKTLVWKGKKYPQDNFGKLTLRENCNSYFIGRINTYKISTLGLFSENTIGGTFSIYLIIGQGIFFFAILIYPCKDLFIGIFVLHFLYIFFPFII